MEALVDMIPNDIKINAYHAESYIVNTKTPDAMAPCVVRSWPDLTMQGARASAAMVLTKLSWNIPVSAPEGLICFSWKVTNDLG